MTEYGNVMMSTQVIMVIHITEENTILRKPLCTMIHPIKRIKAAVPLREAAQVSALDQREDLEVNESI